MPLQQSTIPDIEADEETAPKNQRPSSRPPHAGVEYSAVYLPNQPGPYMDFDEKTDVTPALSLKSSTPPPPENAILEDVLDPQRKAVPSNS